MGDGEIVVGFLLNVSKMEYNLMDVGPKATVSSSGHSQKMCRIVSLAVPISSGQKLVI